MKFFHHLHGFIWKSKIMSVPFVYAIGDCVKIIKGRNEGIQGHVSQIKKYGIVVKSKRASHGVRARSVVLRKKTDLDAAPRNLYVGADCIFDYVKKAAGKKVHQLTLSDWRCLQKRIEKHVFEADE